MFSCLVLSACASTAARSPEPEPEPEADTPMPETGAGSQVQPELVGGVYRHPASGMEFPSELETLVRDNVRTYDDSGADVSVSYRRGDADVALAVTVYIYPRREPLAVEFELAKAAIARMSPGSELITEGGMGLEKRGSVHQGHRAHFIIREGDVPTRISHLFIFDHGPWRVKYRAGFLAHQHELADAIVVRFIRALPWPEVANDPLASVGSERFAPPSDRAAVSDR